MKKVPVDPYMIYYDPVSRWTQKGSSCGLFLSFFFLFFFFLTIFGYGQYRPFSLMIEAKLNCYVLTKMVDIDRFIWSIAGIFTEDRRYYLSLKLFCIGWNGRYRPFSPKPLPMPQNTRSGMNLQQMEARIVASSKSLKMIILEEWWRNSWSLRSMITKRVESKKWVLFGADLALEISFFWEKWRDPKRRYFWLQI